MKNITLILISFSIAAAVNAQSPNPKRGLSFGNPPVQIEDIQAMSGMISWYYNWGTKPESNVAGILSENDVDFIPMAWDEGVNIESLRSYYADHPEAKYLLGFNEPNFLYQANLTPTEAAAEWPKLEAIADEFGLEIVGPAVNWCGDCVSEGGTTYYDPYEYLDDFFAACVDCQVDYIAVHNYMCYSSALVGYLEDFKRFNKKIWLTEFACWDQATITLDMQKNLMYGALDYMDNDTMIYKYAWFMGRSGSGTPQIDVFTSTGGVPTELGEIYLNFNTTHDTSFYAPVPGRIEAEAYSSGFGVQLEATSDFDGLVNVGYIDGGDWMQYNLDVSESGDYFLYLRIAANSNTSTDVWTEDETVSTNVEIRSTGGWQNWKTIGIPLSLSEGNSEIKLTTGSGGFNVNWIAVTTNENSAPTVSAGEDQEFELPQSSAELTGAVEDANNDDLRYKWEKRAGGACDILHPDSALTTVSGLSDGTYRFRLYVSDGIEVVYDEIAVKVIDPVSVEKIGSDGLTAYPNPVGDLLTIELPSEGASCTVEIVSTTGQLLYTELHKQTSNKLEIDFRSFKSGIYLVRLRNKDSIKTIRVLK